MKRKILAVALVLCLMLGSLCISFGVESEEWSVEPSMSIGRFGSGAAVIGSKIYVIGGATDGIKETNIVEVFDVESGMWTVGKSMNIARRYVAAAVVGQKIYTFGGRSQNTKEHNTVEIFDPEKDTWSSGADMPTARHGVTTAVMGENIYVIGGEDAYGNQLGTVEIYNTSMDTWTSGKPLPTPRAYAATAVVQGVIYVIGGTNTTMTTGNKVEKYDAKIDTWSNGIDMPTLIVAASACSIGSEIYVVGGNDTDVATTAGNVYSVKENKWKSLKPLNQARHGSCLVMASGKIYVIGGVTNFIGNIASNTMESINIHVQVQLSILLNIDETAQLSISSRLLDNANLIWTSSDENVATVDEMGKTTAIGEGTAYINAKNADGTFDQSISVKVVPTDADSYRLAMHLNTSQTQKLYLADDPSTVEWSSMDNTVASVSNSGEVTAVKKGLCIVQAKLGEETYAIYVRVA